MDEIKVNIDIDNSWLDWLVGFIEGDGSILVREEGVSLVIIQKELGILEHIKEKLNMGYINYYYKDPKNSKKKIS